MEEKRIKAEAIIRERHYGNSLRARAHKLQRRMEPIKPGKVSTASFRLFSEATRRGFLWTPSPLNYECPRCPGKRVVGNAAGWSCPHLQIPPNAD